MLLFHTSALFWGSRLASEQDPALSPKQELRRAMTTEKTDWLQTGLTGTGAGLGEGVHLAAAHRCVKTQRVPINLLQTLLRWLPQQRTHPQTSCFVSPSIQLNFIYTTSVTVETVLDALQKRRGRPPNWLMFGTLEGGGVRVSGEGQEDRNKCVHQKWNSL